MGESFNQDVKTAFNLYESMIKPILTYASDFWGCLGLSKAAKEQPYRGFPHENLQTDTWSPKANH